MDTALELLGNIYGAYETITDGKEKFEATCRRLRDLLTQLEAMRAQDTLLQSHLIEKYIDIAVRFLEYLDEFNQRHVVTKLVLGKWLLEDIDKFDKELEALFQLYQLAMGSHTIEHEREQDAKLDELTRGMRILLQGVDGSDSCVKAPADDETLASINATATATSPTGGGSANGGGGGNVSPPMVLAPTEAAAACPEIAAALLAKDSEQLVSYLRTGTEAQKIQATRALARLMVRGHHLETVAKAGAIGLLVDALKTETANADLKLHAAKALRSLAVNNANERAIVQAGAIEPLVALLKGGTPELKTAAAGAMENLCYERAHRPLVAAAGAIAPLIELVQGGTKAQQTSATRALRELAVSSKCRPVIAAQGGIAALANLLHSGTPQQCDAAVEALWNLSTDPENKEQIAAVGGIEVLVEQVRSGVTDQQRQRAASALTVLAQDDVNDTRIAAAGGVEALLALLRDGTPGQRNSAAWALSGLTNNDDNKVRVVAAGGIQVILASMDHGGNIEKDRAVQVLCDVARIHEFQSQIVQAGGVPVLVTMLANGSVGQRQTAAATLALLAVTPEGQTAIGQTEAPTLLVELLKSGSGIQRRYAARALRRLAHNHADNRAKLVSLTAVDALLRALETAGQAEKVEELHAIWNLAVDVGVATQIVASGGLPSLVTLLQEGTEEQQIAAAGALKVLSLVRANWQAIESAGAIGAIVGALNTESEGLRTQATAACAYVSVDATLRAAILRHGALPILQQIATDVREPQKTTKLREDAAAALKNLTLDDANYGLMSENGMIGSFVTMLRDESALVRTRAAGGLWNLSLHVPNKSVIASTPNALEHLLAAIKIGDDKEKERAAGTLRSLAMETTIATEICARGGVDVLFGLLESGSTEQQRQAAGALWHLSSSADLTATRNVADLVPTLVGALRGDHGDQDLTKALLGTLSNLAEAVDSIDHIVDSGALEVLVSLASSSEDHARIATVTLGSIAKKTELAPTLIALGAAAEMIKILEGSVDGHREDAINVLLHLALSQELVVIEALLIVVPVILQLVRDAHDGKDLRSLALQALCNMAVHRLLAEAIANTSGLPILIELLKKCPASQQAPVISTIRHLTYYGSSQLVLELDGIGLLLHYLDTVEPGARSDATIALWNVACDGPEAQDHIGRRGGIDVLVKVTRAGQGDEKEHAIGALAVLITCDKNAARAIEAGIIDVAIEAIRSNNEKIQQAGLAMLVALAQQEGIATKLAAAGVIAPTLAILEKADTTLGDDATRLLTALSENEACRSIIFSTGGVAALQKLAKGGSTRQKSEATLVLARLQSAAF